MAAFYAWLRDIIICLFVISLIDQLLLDSVYKKYMRVAAGLILIVVVMTPVLKIFGAETKLSYFFNLETLKTKIGAVDYPEAMYGAEAERLEYVTENYKMQLEEQVTALFKNEPVILGSVDIEIDENADSENFGRVCSVSASAVIREEKNGAVIEPVVIGTEHRGYVPAEYADDIDTMRKKIADHLCMDVSAVAISMA